MGVRHSRIAHQFMECVDIRVLFLKVFLEAGVVVALVLESFTIVKVCASVEVLHVVFSKISYN